MRPRRLWIMSAWKSPEDHVEWSVVDATIDQRLAEITAWLRENKLFAGNPEEMGSVERAYWHFGYLSALQDMRGVLAEKKRTNN